MRRYPYRKKTVEEDGILIARAKLFRNYPAFGMHEFLAENDLTSGQGGQEEPQLQGFCHSQLKPFKF